MGGGRGLFKIIVKVFVEPDARLLSIRVRRQAVSPASGFDCHARHLQPGAPPALTGCLRGIGSGICS